MLHPDPCEARVSTLDGDRTAVVVLLGELDSYSAALLVERIDQLLPPAPCELLLDVTELAFLDTGGLDLFTRLDERGYQVELTSSEPLIELVLEYWAPATAPSA